MEVKLCTKCGIEKSISEFGKHKCEKDGLCGHCKECTRNNRRAYYKKNRELFLKQQQRYKLKNPQKLKDRQTKWRKANLQWYSEKAYKWQKEHPEKALSTQRKKVENLNDCYIRKELIKRGWPKEAITNDLIELQRSLIKYKRYAKDKTKTPEKHS